MSSISRYKLDETWLVALGMWCFSALYSDFWETASMLIRWDLATEEILIKISHLTRPRYAIDDVWNGPCVVTGGWNYRFIARGNYEICWNHSTCAIIDCATTNWPAFFGYAEKKKSAFHPIRTTESPDLFIRPRVLRKRRKWILETEISKLPDGKISVLACTFGIVLTFPEP